MWRRRAGNCPWHSGLIGLSSAFEHSSWRPTPTSLSYLPQTETSYIRASNINSSSPTLIRTPKTNMTSINTLILPEKSTRRIQGKGRPNIVDIGLVEGKWERIPLYGASSTGLPCKTFRQKWTLNVYLAYHRTGYLGDTALFNGHGYIADPSFIGSWYVPSFIEGCGSKRLGRFWDIYLCISSIMYSSLHQLILRSRSLRKQSSRSDHGRAGLSIHRAYIV